MPWQLQFPTICSAGYHPQPDAAETVNRLALRVLRSIAPALAHRWDELIDLIEFAIVGPHAAVYGPTMLAWLSTCPCHSIDGMAPIELW